MATNHTEHYQLNQWEPGDKVLRTEFNEDNAKIDGALAAINRLQELDKVVMPTSGNNFKLNLKGIDWTKWQYIGATIDIPGGKKGSDFPIYDCVINDNTVSGHCSAGSTLARFNPYALLLILLPFHDPKRAVKGIYLGDPSGVGFGDCTFEELTNLSFGSSEPYPAQTTATLWGIS